MLHRIRLAMQNNSLMKLGGGKSRNMHKHIRARRISKTGGADKAMAFEFLSAVDRFALWSFPTGRSILFIR
jgi:hypothetical protein